MGRSHPEIGEPTTIGEQSLTRGRYLFDPDPVKMKNVFGPGLCTVHPTPLIPA